MRTWTKVAAAAVLVLAPLAACSDDDDAAPATTVAKGADTAFCKAAKQIAEQDGFPTVAQVEAYGKAAPEDIQDDVAIVLPVVRDHDDPVSKMAAFAADDVEVATQHMNADETKLCGIDHSEDSRPSEAIDPTADRVDVTAVEYQFQMPENIPAGKSSFVLDNQGQEAHFMDVVQILPGHTLDEALAYKGDPADAGIVAHKDYKSGIAAPGIHDQEVVNVDLQPGSYAMLCFISGPDGTPHAFLGMAKPLTVS